jgi:hypothetical protein
MKNKIQAFKDEKKKEKMARIAAAAENADTMNTTD